MRNLKKLPDFINSIEVIEDLGMNNQKPRKRIAKFLCDCGNTFVAKINAVKVGHRKSCGCARNGNPSHGLSNHPLYRKWSGMITRTTNKKEDCYPRYGGRGIIVCDEWRNDFKSFYDWSIANGWINGLTIDREDNDGNYEPSNCQFITMKENTLKDMKMFKPTVKQVKSICSMYIEDSFTVSFIAECFNVHQEAVSKILKNNNIKIDKNRRMTNVSKNTRGL